MNRSRRCEAAVFLILSDRQRGVMAKFDDFAVGDKAELEHVITAEDISKFVDLTGDDNKLHVDPQYAAETAFKKPVVHGMLGASFISTVIGTRLPGDGALWFAQNLEFLLPVRVGDTLKVCAEIIKKIDSAQILEIKTDLFNQHGQKVTTGIAKVKIVDHKPKAEAAAAPSLKKVALVIGGSGGIGAAICRKLARDGFAVAVHCHQNAAAAATVMKEIEAAGGRALTVSGDIRDAASMTGLVDCIERRLGAVTLLVNCATAKLIVKGFKELTWNDLENHVSISLKGAFNAVKAVLPSMEMQRYGKIIHLGSLATDEIPVGMLPYVTMKSALDGFSRALAMELGPRNILVNMVAPGMADTDLNADIPERVRLLNAAQTPLKRLAKPEDIAGAVAFLASDQADFLAGETIRVNGGKVMR